MSQEKPCWWPTFWFSLALNGGKGLIGQSFCGELPFPSFLPLLSPCPLPPSPQSPCALFPALARLFYTQIPMRRSSCLLECQVSPWDPSDPAQLWVLTTVPAPGASHGSEPRRARTCDTCGHICTCMVTLAQPYRPLARSQNHQVGFKKRRLSAVSA